VTTILARIDVPEISACTGNTSCNLIAERRAVPNDGAIGAAIATAQIKLTAASLIVNRWHREHELGDIVMTVSRIDRMSTLLKEIVRFRADKSSSKDWECETQCLGLGPELTVTMRPVSTFIMTVTSLPNATTVPLWGLITT
jgi:hypothetical protein